eukprot:3586843-Rhodomonas_salina.9
MHVLTTFRVVMRARDVMCCTGQTYQMRESEKALHRKQQGAWSCICRRCCAMSGTELAYGALHSSLRYQPA